ncbi:MAG: glycosyltransferase family 2 protein [Hyphomonadaceae bacterium]|nr:glycosyltransferase family 2 protein [Hyphomonadaceae bacterium]
MKTYPTVSVVMPVYNTEAYVCGAVNSVLAQSFRDFELIIVDDAGSDRSMELCRAFDDPRIRIISQENRGLAGARNTGIRNARGEFIALLDSDDLWEADKLACHVSHLRNHPGLGVSYAASRMMDDDGNLLRILQRPKLHDITPQDIFLRNPVGNGSAPVIRRDVFTDIAFRNPQRNELDYFDESFRQSEDIECWIRIALTTHWRFEGIRGAYTRYRINAGGLSANVVRQFETWLRVRDKVRAISPGFARQWEARAEAYQLRYLARRCVRMGDGAMAFSLMLDALRRDASITWRAPMKSATTFAAAMLLRFAPASLNRPLQASIQRGQA